MTFIFGFLLLLFISYGEIFNFRTISKFNNIKNILTSVFVGSGFVITLAIIFINSKEINTHLEVFKDWRLYIGLCLEIFGVWLTRKNYELNHDNVTAINFSLFFGIILVPLISFYLTDLFNFSSGINLKYASVGQLYSFLVVFLVLMIAYFFDKLKGHINNVYILFLMPISLSCSIFWTTKMMQVYEGIIYYALVGFSLLCFFSIAAILNKEYKNLHSSQTKTFMVIASFSALILPLNILAIKYLAVEFVTLFKRISQLLVAINIDRKHKKVIIKDKIVIVLLIISTFLMFLSTRN
jgi:hypothetical protein